MKDCCLHSFSFYRQCGTLNVFNADGILLQVRPKWQKSSSARPLTTGTPAYSTQQLFRIARSRRSTVAIDGPHQSVCYWHLNGHRMPSARRQMSYSTTTSDEMTYKGHPSSTHYRCAYRHEHTAFSEAHIAYTSFSSNQVPLIYPDSNMLVTSLFDSLACSCP